MIDKEAAFHELMDRMENNTCPICDMVEYRYNETVDRFFYENVNTPHLRYKIEKANGFCTYHAQKLSERNDPLTHAILYHDFLQNVIEQGDNKKSKIDFHNHKKCFFCENVMMNEEDYTKAFAEFLKNDAFREKYIEKSMLCVTHLMMIKNVKFKDKKSFNKAYEATIEKYKALNENLSELKRKNDYRYVKEEWTEEEKLSWKKAIDVFNGRIVKMNDNERKIFFD